MESNLKLSLEKLGYDIYDLNFRYFNSIEEKYCPICNEVCEDSETEE